MQLRRLRARHLIGLGGALSAVAVAMGLSAPATAAATNTTVSTSSGSTGPVAVHKVASQASADASTYWTPERMRNAKPMDRVLDRRAVETAGSGSVVRGLPTVVAPTVSSLTDVLPLAVPQLGGPWTEGGAVRKTTGRVFFTFQGGDASCSGSAVTSANRSVVITAGHCVKYQGSWHKNWVFVPAYRDGDRPYGTWPARVTLTTPQWQRSEDLDYDVGAAVVSTRNGRRLIDVVGGQGIAFNQARGQTMYSFGYPAEGSYDGERLIYCSGLTLPDLLGSTDQGLPCTMTGGSSGGPWFLRFNESTGTGVVNSVNSFTYTLVPNVMFGPYFGTEAQRLYRTAEAR